MTRPPWALACWLWLVAMIGAGGGAAIGMLACGSTGRVVEHAVVADIVECTTADRAKLEAQFGPAIEQALQRAIGLDGKIDVPSLSQVGAALEVDGWCVLEKEVARLIAAARNRNPSAPAAAAAQLDADDLAAKVAALRAQKFGATQFRLGGT
jgi:hypothetical protein